MNTHPNGHDTVEQYLLDQLSEDERTKFEIQMLEDPELVNEVQLREVMIDQLRSNLNNEPQVSLDKISKDKNIIRLSFQEWIQQPFSIAASCLVATFVVALMGLNAFNREHPQDLPLNIASNLFIENTRGNDNSINTRGVGPILLTIDVGPVAESLGFDVNIYNESNIAVYNYQDAVIDDQGLLRVLIDRTLVGTHTINVITSSRNPSTNNYNISVDVNFTE